MMDKDAMINSCKIILEKQQQKISKNHYEIQVRTILVCTLYSIKYSTLTLTLAVPKSYRGFVPGLSLKPASEKHTGLFCLEVKGE